MGQGFDEGSRRKGPHVPTFAYTFIDTWIRPSFWRGSYELTLWIDGEFEPETMDEIL